MLVDPDENPRHATTASPASSMAASGGKIEVLEPSLYTAGDWVKPPVLLPRKTLATPTPLLGACMASTASPEWLTASFGVSLLLVDPLFTSLGLPNDDAPV